MTTIHRSLKYLISTWLQQGNCCCHSEILRQLIWYLMWWLKILPVDATNQIPHVRHKNTVPNDGREMSWASYLILTETSVWFVTGTLHWASVFYVLNDICTASSSQTWNPNLKLREARNKSFLGSSGIPWKIQLERRLQWYLVEYIGLSRTPIVNS